MAELVVTCRWLVGLGAVNFESDLGSSAAGDVGQEAQSACVVLEGQARLGVASFEFAHAFGMAATQPGVQNWMGFGAALVV